jgi:predicted enzyme involved in methoxymalonyl-ACP biosynthesis
MSCRVIGRGVEREMCNRLIAAAQARGIARLLGEYIPTAKNALVQNLYGDLGFTRNSDTQWELRLADYNPHRTWFADGK